MQGLIKIWERKYKIKKEINKKVNNTDMKLQQDNRDN